MPNVMGDDADRAARGRGAFASQFRMTEAAAIEALTSVVGARMAAEVINAAGGVWSADDRLSLRDRSLVVVAALITLGGVEDRLRGHVRWALDHGVTPDELESMTTLLGVYVGYARASVGMEVIREVVADEASGGKHGPAD
jgi:alkylhydroperoxidase/carboxymuconolactone decarboxylase family protein YurZ